MWWIILKWENTDNPGRENEELSDSMWLGALEGVPQEILQQIVGKPDWNSIRKCKWDNTAPLWIAKIPLAGNQDYLCTAAPCKGRDAQIPAGNAALWPCNQEEQKSPPVKKYNSPEYWEPNLHGFMICLGFYWSHLYSRAVPLTGAIGEQTHLSGMVHQRSSASH